MLIQSNILSAQQFIYLFATIFFWLTTIVTPNMVWAKGIFSQAIYSKELEYIVKRGDSPEKIRARFGLPETTLLRDNGLKPNQRLAPGTRLRISSQHIVLEHIEEGILINLPQRMLYYFEEGKLNVAFPVGLGKPTWPTPTGTFTIASRQANKSWLVPKSIQEEMRLEGKAVITEVPPGPKNPLGKHWLGLSIPGYGIHGTTSPNSIYRFRSHGCIRLHPDDIQVLFDKVELGTEGQIVYIPVLMAQLPDQRIFLEVHTDVYKKAEDPMKTVRKLAEKHGVTEQIDWEHVKEIVRRKEGQAREITLYDEDEDDDE